VGGLQAWYAAEQLNTIELNREFACILANDLHINKK